MVTTYTPEARPSTTHTREARKGLLRTKWVDFTSIAWSDDILSGIAWSDLPIFSNTPLTNEARPATTLTNEART